MKELLVLPVQQQSSQVCEGEPQVFDHFPDCIQSLVGKFPRPAQKSIHTPHAKQHKECYSADKILKQEYEQLI